MKKLYEKSEFGFFLVTLSAYCLLQSAAHPLERIIGVRGSVSMLFNAFMSLCLLGFIRKNGIARRYGLYRSGLPARRFLWYIPLVVTVSCGAFNGLSVNMPWADTVCCAAGMVCVGLIEELLFRGFLLRALAKGGVKSAAFVSSLIFGLMHLLNLTNGGLNTAWVLCQVCLAVAVGYLFATVVCRGGGLLPCVAAHSAMNVLSVFTEFPGTAGNVSVFMIFLVQAAASVAYSVFLIKTLPAAVSRLGK